MGDNMWMTLVTLLASLNTVLLGAFLYRSGVKESELNAKLDRVHDELNGFKVEASDKYARSDRMEEFMRAIMQKLDVIQRELAQKEDRK